VSWKHDIQLRDLDADRSIEVACRRCGQSYYRQVSELLGLGEMSYLDEVEKRLACQRRGCRGGVRLSLMDNAETDGFVGGLP
jgi:hypothetical protein